MCVGLCLGGGKAVARVPRSDGPRATASGDVYTSRASIAFRLS